MSRDDRQRQGTWMEGNERTGKGEGDKHGHCPMIISGSKTEGVLSALERQPNTHSRKAFTKIELSTSGVGSSSNAVTISYCLAPKRHEILASTGTNTIFLAKKILIFLDLQ